MNAPDMSKQQFHEALGKVCAWVEQYRNAVEGLPVLSRAQPGQILKTMPAAPPERGDPVEAWLKDLDDILLPAITHWNHPGFLAYFANTGSAPGILGELITGALNVNGMLWKTCPAATELEQVVLRWFLIAMGLPATWFGIINDTASTSTLMALAAAREATGLGVRELGLSGKVPLVLYCSEEAHSSVDKAAIILGLGTRAVHRIPTDDQLRMRPDLLEATIRKDRAEGHRPFAIVATVGTTSSTSIDPVPAIARISHENGLWLHVDAAYAGAAALAPELRWVVNGCEEADSYVTNPHKWLATPMDCSTLFTRRPEAFLETFSLQPEYLRTDVRDVVDYMDYSFQLGRRFRALKLWFVFRCYGTDGLAKRIREHVRLAQDFARWVDNDPQMERMAPAPLSVVCFRVHPEGMDDEAALESFNSTVLEHVNATGEVFVSHAKIKGRYALHLAIGNLQTSERHVRRAFDLVRSAAGIS